MINNCTLQFDQGGQFMEIALLVVTSSTPTLTDIDNINTDLWQNLQAQTITDCFLRKITLGSGGTYLEKSYPNTHGGKIGVACTSNQAYHIRKNVTSGRPGSFFWPGVYAGAYNPNGQASSTLNSDMATALTAVHTALAGHGLDITVPQKGGGHSVATSFSLRPTVGNQRRRLR